MSLRMSEEDYESYLSRRKNLEKLAIANGLPGPKKSKYRNQKVVVNGETFDSKKEYSRYVQLKMMESAGQISDLKRQQSFILAPAVTLDGRRKPSLKYCCDFLYYRELPDGSEEMVVEDVKSAITSACPVFRIKKHLMMSVHGIEIQEV